MNALLALILFAQCGPQGCPAPSFSAPALQQPVSIPQGSLDAVCRVYIPGPGRMSSLGSGSLVDTDLVVTNWHVVKEGSGKGSVTFKNGKQVRATVLDYSVGADLAVLKLTTRVNVQPVELTDAVPGQTLVIAGYGGDDTLLPQAGRWVRTSTTGTMILVGCQARQGDSGGPILNTRGQLCGVLWGASRGETAGTPCGALRRLLERIRARFVGPTSPTNPGQGSAQPSQPAAQDPGPLPGPIVAAPVSPPADNPPILSGPDPAPPAGGASPSIAIPMPSKPAAGGGLLAAAESFAGGLLTTLGPIVLPGLPGVGVALLGHWLARRSSAGLASSIVGQLRQLATGAAASVASVVAPSAAQPVNPYQPPQVVLNPAPAPSPPSVVMTEVESAASKALVQGLETWASRTPANAAQLNLIYSFRDQLLNRKN